MHLAEYLALRPVPAAGVVLSLTGRCPLHCAHCSTESTTAGTDLPGAALVRFVDTFGSPDEYALGAGNGARSANGRRDGADERRTAAPARNDGRDAPVPPAVALLTGGEPLLRPRLVRQLAERCRAVGTATFLLTGLFPARTAVRGSTGRAATDTGPTRTGAGRATVPPAIAAALAAVDHVSVSLDAFHEREVPRAAVFAELHRLLDAGQDVSLHLLAAGPADPYPDVTAAAVRREFGTRVPLLVGRLAPVGRARSLAPQLVNAPAGTGGSDDEPGSGSASGSDAEPGSGSASGSASGSGAFGGSGPGTLPCAMAAWPVVGLDGTVTACCNQSVLDHRPVPPHLLLGRAPGVTWPAVRARTLRSPALRTIRTLGPDALRTDGAAGAAGPGGCAGCRALSEPAPSPQLVATVDALETPVAALQARAGAAGFAGRYGSARHADLALWGAADAAGGARGPRWNG